LRQTSSLFFNRSLGGRPVTISGSLVINSCQECVHCEWQQRRTILASAIGFSCSGSSRPRLHAVPRLFNKGIIVAFESRAFESGVKIDYIYGPTCMLIAPFVFFCVLETKDRTLEELDELFYKDVSVFKLSLMFARGRLLLIVRPRTKRSPPGRTD
jgi:hypothetical protein